MPTFVYFQQHFRAFISPTNLPWNSPAKCCPVRYFDDHARCLAPGWFIFPQDFYSPRFILFLFFKHRQNPPEGLVCTGLLRSTRRKMMSLDILRWDFIASSLCVDSSTTAPPRCFSRFCYFWGYVLYAEFFYCSPQSCNTSAFTASVSLRCLWKILRSFASISPAIILQPGLIQMIRGKEKTTGLTVRLLGSPKSPAWKFIFITSFWGINWSLSYGDSF